MFGELIVEALRNLRRHQLRSLLTALGIVFGIASVVAMVATGEGARRAMLAQIRELGTDNVLVSAEKPPVPADTKQNESWVLDYGLTFRDLEQIRATVPLVASAVPVHDRKEWLWFGSRRVDAKIRGVPPEYFPALDLRPIRGRLLLPEDERERRRVCVVRARVLHEARYVGDPLRLDLKLGQEYYRVVGVLPDFATDNEDRRLLGLDARSYEVYVPFATVTERHGFTKSSFVSGSYETTRTELHQIVCKVGREDDVPAAAQAIQAVLTRFHERKDYAVTVPIELLQQRARTQRTFDLVLPVIAGISLLVGGIGILNIMLASITERTREIGIRRAIGASRGDVLAQFLVETVTLTLCGGVLGVVLGIGGGYALEAATGWPSVITPWAIVLSLAIAVSTGILFGLYPAQRAARMDPVRALRHD